MSRADDLRAQADAIEAEERLAGEHEAALAAHRADVNDPDLKAAYAQAKQALVDARRATRAERDGLGVGGDAVDTTGLSDDEAHAHVRRVTGQEG